MNNISLPRALLCGYCDCSEFGTLKTSPERTAKSFEIEYYLENGFETYLNGEKIPIFADRILIARPGDVRYSRLPFKTAFLKFNADGELAEMLYKTPTYFTAVHKKQILELMHEIIVLNEKEEKDPLMSGGKLLTLLSIIINDGKCEQRGQGVNRQLMHRAKKYIEDHFREHISTTDIAESVDLSESRFRVLFARVRLYNGTGKIVINDREMDDYFGLETLKLIVRQPLTLTETTDKFDVICRVAGGGVTGQAGAIRHGIARALLQHDEALRPVLKKAGLLTRDPRMKERKKYGLKGARRAPQFSKR